MEIKDIIGKKVAIWCDTEEKANDFLGKVRKNINTIQYTNSYNDFKENTCYRVLSELYAYCDKQWYIENGYEIISYNDFFGISEQVESDTLTAVEVLEWLGKKYFSKEYPKIFGKSYSMARLIGDLGAEEVVKRITSYELEQRKAKVSDEEITLLLNEKYGVGKWVRK